MQFLPVPFSLDKMNITDTMRLLLLTFYQTQVHGVRSETNRPFADLTELTLADKDTNPILTVTANRAIQCNVASDAT